MILNEAEQQEISAAIAAVEKTTDAELVTVLARRADNYYYIPTLWAALIALLLPILVKFTPFWLSGDELLWMQWLTFILLAVVLRIPFIMMKLVPTKVRYWRASNLARRQFLDNNLHHTKDDMGVLIFVSEAEHYVEIIADRGISRHVSNETWQEIIDTFVTAVKKGQTNQGFLDCIASCGVLLNQHAPATQDKNELPNRLIILD